MNQKHTAVRDFATFGLSAEVEAGVKDAGFKEPSPIQNEVIPIILAGRDVIAQSETGTGKTAAFGLPIMSRFLPADKASVLVIVPTRELALQVSNELCMLGKHAGARAAVVYGGASARDQISKISHGATIVTGTPGRILDLLSSRRIELSPSVVVLDEADRMLDMGFIEDIEKIFSYLPKERQTLLFSATLPERIQKLAGRILKDPVRVKTGSTQTTPKITQSFCIVSEHEREPALLRLFDFDPPERAIVFCRTKRETDELTGRLISRGIEARAIHGDMDQKHREQVLSRFRAGKIRTLIATDVAARGLDVPDITHVFNYHIPFDKDSYTHRIGRTGRAGKEGRSITFVAPGEMFRWMRMARETGDADFLRIPSLDELRAKRQEDLAETIRTTEPGASSARLLEKLSTETNNHDLILRLLTLLDAKLPAEGPEKIGKDNFQPQERGHGSERPSRRRDGRRNRKFDDRPPRSAENRSVRRESGGAPERKFHERPRTAERSEEKRPEKREVSRHEPRKFHERPRNPDKHQGPHRGPYSDVKKKKPRNAYGPGKEKKPSAPRADHGAVKPKPAFAKKKKKRDHKKSKGN